MDRFVSNFTNRVDAKGRVSIPASFRLVLGRDGFEGLYVHPALDMAALDAGGNALLGEIDGLAVDNAALFGRARSSFDGPSGCVGGAQDRSRRAACS
jgi:MraZ protein